MKKVLILFTFCILGILNQPTYESQQLREEFSLKRTACLLLSNYYSNPQSQAIQQIVQELDSSMQQKYVDKMYAVAIEHCMSTISYQQSKNFLIQQKSSNPSKLSYVFDSFDFTKNVKNINSLTPRQESLIKFMKAFNEQIQIQREQKEAQQKENRAKPQMKFFGISENEIPSSAKIIYAAIFVILIILGISFCLNKINNPQKGNCTIKPKKKQKKKKQS